MTRYSIATGILWIFAIVALLGTLLLGCNSNDDSNDTSSDSDTDTDTDADSDSDADSDTDSDVDCMNLSQEECFKAYNECNSVSGKRIDVESECVEEEDVYFGCVVLYTESCGLEEAIGYAIEPKTGDCYMFPGLCFPDGWQEYGANLWEDPRCNIPNIQSGNWEWCQ